MKPSAIILAAGQSTRMGQPKMLLPWGETTVIGKVIETFQKAGAANILVVTGGAKEQIEKGISHYSVQTAHNPKSGEMLDSIQVGLREQSGSEAVIIALGDQPQIEETTVLRIIEAWDQHHGGIIVPSYEKRRGHPWLIQKKYWGEILAMQADQSMRDFFNQHQGEIFYANVSTPSILQDLDTPEDYLKFKP